MAGEIRYARSGDVSIAYSVHGEGPLTLVVAPGFVSHQEVLLDFEDRGSAELKGVPGRWELFAVAS